MKKCAWLLLFCGCSANPNYQANLNAASELPVTRVVMYQNGVGYFERRGHIDGDVLRLQVRPSQINDLLKSLTLVDAHNGRAVSVSLPLDKTAQQKLEELPAQVQQAGGLLAVLNVFRGARVEIRGSKGKIAGRVLGVEQLDSGPQGSWRVTLKTDDKGLAVYPVAAIEGIAIEDHTLDTGLDKSLDVSLSDGQWKPISVAIKLAGDSEHDLLVSYITEMPLWKPAYRLVVGDQGVLLQGWAVVDNISGEDWRDVQLSLVAGMPMSFIYNLHAPRFMGRVDLTPKPGEMALAPVIEKAGQMQAPAPPPAAYGMGMAAPSTKSSAPMKEYSRKAKKMLAPSRSLAGAAYDEEAEKDDDISLSAELLEQQVEARVEGSAAGSLFRYDLQDRVDVPDHSSTLVSLINKKVSGKEIVLFRPEDGGNSGGNKTHPYRAVFFANETGLVLEKGPVTIYSGGTFVGEGFVERLERGATSFLAYAVDGNVDIQRSDSSGEENFRLLKIVNGVLEVQASSVSRNVYKIANRNEEKISAYIKTPRRSGWTLRNQSSEQVETSDAYFMPHTVEAGKTTELTIEWTTPVKRHVTMDTDLSTQVLNLYLGSGKVPEAIAVQLKEILKIKERLSAIVREENELQKQGDLLNADQDRVRANIETLRRTTGNKSLLDGLIEKLTKQEESLGRISGKLVRLSEERAQLTAKLSVLISQISLDNP